MRQRRKLVVGALMLAIASMLTAIPSSAAVAGQVSHVTRYGGAGTGPCEVTLRGGLRAVVSAQGGEETAHLIDPSAAKGGVFAVNSGGHQILVPAAALPDLRSGAADISAYDTALLAEHTCGTPAPEQGTVTRAADTGGTARAGRGSAHRPYKLARLTIRTLNTEGVPADKGWIQLLNVDDERLVNVHFLFTHNGVGRWALPVGHYAALAMMDADIVNDDYTFVINPEFTLTRDTTITLDERTATVHAATPTTPRPSTLESSSVDVGRSDGSGPGDWIAWFNLSSHPATFTFNPSGRVRHGGFVVDPSYELNSPSTAPKPYHYHVAEAFDHVPERFPTKVDPAGLATVQRDYGAPGAAGATLSINIPQTRWQVASGPANIQGFSTIQLGTSRTEYYSGGPTPVDWITAMDSRDSETMYTAFHEYRAGTTLKQSLLTGPEHPGVYEDLTGTGTTCPACAARGALQFDIYPVGDNMPGDVEPWPFTGGSNAVSFELRRGDCAEGRCGVLAQGDYDPEGVSITAPEGTARYRLVEKWTRAAAGVQFLSTASETTWAFTADSGGTHGRIPANWTCVDGSHDCSALPLLYAYYKADADLLNNLVPGAHTLTLDVEHQQHSVAPPISGASVSVSYDDGATWVPAAVTGDEGHYRASFTVPATGTDGYTAIRIAAWDRAGNRIDQTVQRAYTIR